MIFFVICKNFDAKVNDIPILSLKYNLFTNYIWKLSFLKTLKVFKGNKGAYKEFQNSKKVLLETLYYIKIKYCPYIK